MGGGCGWAVPSGEVIAAFGGLNHLGWGSGVDCTFWKGDLLLGGAGVGLYHLNRRLSSVETVPLK